MINPFALGLSLLGVGIMAMAYLNRDEPAWQRDMRAIVILAVGQVILGGAVAALDLLGR